MSTSTQNGSVGTAISFATLDQDYERLTQAFEAIAQVKSGHKRRFYLVRTAPFHGLPRNEMLKSYDLWVFEQAAGIGGGHESPL